MLKRIQRKENDTPILPNDNCKLVSDLAGYEECKGYAVDVNGNMYTCKAHNMKPYWFKDSWSPFKTKINQGYVYCIMSNFGEDVSAKVHRLVALAFISNPKGYPIINHKDGNKQNNNLNNLEWCTHKENSRHYIRMGIRDTAKGVRMPNAKLNDEKVRQIRLLSKQGMKNKDIASIYDMEESGISRVIHRETWRHVI